MSAPTPRDEPGPATGSSRIADPAGPTRHGEAGAGAFWLFRHGETEWSRDRRHTSRTDVPLTPHGEQQAAAVGELLAGVHPVLVLASPRRRARHTAELAGLAPIALDPDLVEWDYGRYEGLTTAQIREERPGWTIWTGDPPGGETREQVRERADRALGRVRAALPDGDVVVVAHGHFGRVLAARWLGLQPADARVFALDPAAACVLSTEHGTPVVYRWNLPNPVAAAAAARTRS